MHSPVQSLPSPLPPVVTANTCKQLYVKRRLQSACTGPANLPITGVAHAPRNNRTSHNDNSTQTQRKRVCETTSMCRYKERIWERSGRAGFSRWVVRADARRRHRRTLVSASYELHDTYLTLWNSPHRFQVLSSFTGLFATRFQSVECPYVDLRWPGLTCVFIVVVLEGCAAERACSQTRSLRLSSVVILPCVVCARAIATRQDT